MTAIKVSIITTTYNDAHLHLFEQIRSTINSFHLATPGNMFSQIIVDDGSFCPQSLKSLEYIKCSNIPGLTVIHTDNQGLPAARNFALHQADASHIIALDADDIIHPYFIREILQCIESSTDVLVSTDWAMFGSRHRRFRVRQATPYNIRFANYLPVSTAFPLKCFPQNQYASEMTDGFEDWEFWIRLICSGYQHRNIPRCLFFHREHLNNMTHQSLRKSKDIYDHIKSRNSVLYDSFVNSTLLSKYPPSLFDIVKQSFSPRIRNLISTIR